MPWRTFAGRRVIAVANPSRGAEALAAFGGETLALAPSAAIRRTIARQFGPAMVRDAEARCPEDRSCRTLLADGFTVRKATVLAAIAALLVWMPGPLFALAFLWVLLAQAATVGLRILALFARWRGRGAQSVPGAATRLSEHRRKPSVSILVPLKGEAAVAGQLLAALGKMDYPEALLDIKLVLESHDTATLAAIERAGLPPTVEVVRVPRGTIETKPRAMNYALPFCKGEIVGIYDAEDAPDPGQIRAVVQHLMEADPRVGCVQGCLDFYNDDDNPLVDLLHHGLRAVVPRRPARHRAGGVSDPARGDDGLLPQDGAREDRLLGRAQRHRGRRPRDAARPRGLSLRDDRDHDEGGGLRR